jgi:hypothetical protein
MRAGIDRIDGVPVQRVGLLGLGGITRLHILELVNLSLAASVSPPTVREPADTLDLN